MSDTSVLGYALLGLIQQRPSSGYDLRKIFAETAMGNYSSSPGAIYPALERLESQGLIFGVVKDSAGLRRRRVYRLTLKGTAELRKWLTRPIEQGDVKRGMAELMLRFAFTDKALGPEAAIAFLQRFRAVLKPYTAGLQAFLRANAERMPLSGRLALECGIRSYRSLYAWTDYAVRQYRESQQRTALTKPNTHKGGLR
ncbi:MAG: PadR family transcriptional regulator [Candidatus Korobacteraceae bacterium]